MEFSGLLLVHVSGNCNPEASRPGRGSCAAPASSAPPLPYRFASLHLEERSTSLSTHPSSTFPDPSASIPRASALLLPNDSEASLPTAVHCHNSISTLAAWRACAPIVGSRPQPAAAVRRPRGVAGKVRALHHRPPPRCGLLPLPIPACLRFVASSIWLTVAARRVSGWKELLQGLAMLRQLQGTRPSTHGNSRRPSPAIRPSSGLRFLFVSPPDSLQFFASTPLSMLCFNFRSGIFSAPAPQLQRHHTSGATNQYPTASSIATGLGKFHLPVMYGTTENFSLQFPCQTKLRLLVVR
jgi:hypothetical protein